MVNLYRIIQEILTNTVKHAKASEVLIKITEQENSLIAEVRENGIGFDFENLQKKDTGLGLKGILMRTSLLKGKINYSSADGSKYILVIPIDKDNI